MLRVALVNLCEESYGYGPGASEYLRAALVASLGDRARAEVFFLESVAPGDAADRILAFEPDLIGVTCYSWNLEASGELSRLLKRRAPEVPIVWGGCSFSHLRERGDWFRWWSSVDAIAIGFGEATLVELCEQLLERGRMPGAPIAGLAMRTPLGVRFGPPARLSASASPYLLGTARPVPRPYVEVARGCKYNCTFCSDARVSRDGIFIAHPVERLAAEIASVVRWPCAEWIDAGASTANVTHAALAGTCEGIRRGDPGGRLVYSFQLYPSLVREEDRRAFDGVRVGKLLFGLQSTTPETFAPMRRSGSIEHLARAIAILRDVGPIYVSVLLGLPGETLASFRRVIDEVSAIEGAHVSVHRLLVLPGTQLHTRHEELGLRFDEQRFYRLMESREMSSQDMLRAQDYVIERAIAKGRAPGRGPWIDWTNFDVQARAFDAPELVRR